MINVGVIGVGYWGPNIVRNFIANPNTNVTMCADIKEQRLNVIKGLYPSVATSTDYRDIVRNTAIDLVVICTPVFSHYELAKEALQNGKHVLVEKPMTHTAAQAEDLLNVAAGKNRQIFVDHTFVYTGAVRKIAHLIDDGELGDLYYFDSVRVNLGLFQHDVNVLWDLAPHDISIMQHLLSARPQGVVATGSAHFDTGLEDVAYMTVYYPDNLIAHIHVNWLSPVKVRQSLLAGSKKMVVWDDNNPSEKLRVYDKGIEVVETEAQVYQTLIQYRTGDMYCPKISNREALAVEVDEIVEWINGNKLPRVATGEDGLMVVRILEAAQQSLKNRGREVRI
jgi:predicted dehydrogenase